MQGHIFGTSSRLSRSDMMPHDVYMRPLVNTEPAIAAAARSTFFYSKTVNKTIRDFIIISRQLLSP